MHRVPLAVVWLYLALLHQGAVFWQNPWGVVFRLPAHSVGRVLQAAGEECLPYSVAVSRPAAWACLVICPEEGVRVYLMR